MKETLVTYKQAERLKQLNFNWWCREYYIMSWYEKKSQLPSRRKHPRSHKIYMDALNADPKVRLESFEEGDCSNSDLVPPKYPTFSWRDECIMPHYKYATAPTLDQAARWLREEKGIAINIIAHDGGSYHWEEVYLPNFKEQEERWLHRSTLNRFPSYDEALTDGLDIMLTLLTTKNK